MTSIRRLVDTSKAWLACRCADDDAAVLPLFAAMMVLLIGMAAFATDLGWFYVNATRAQRAAEAAALSGVIELPDNPTAASATAVSIAAQNGFTVDADTSVTPNPQPGGNVTQLQVTIQDQVDTFFLQVFGMRTQTITRTAVAEYLPPLPLGSPTNLFGNDPVTGTYPNFWANIHGTHTDTRMGDAFSSRCAEGAGSGNSGCAVNPTFRSSGYIYGVEAGSGAVTVRVLDGMFRNESGGNPNADNIRTGDHNNWCGGSGCLGPTTTWRLYNPDATPLDLSDNGPPICVHTFAPEAQVPASDPWQPTDWVNICNFSATPGLVYPLQVTVDGTGTDDDGLNRYSIKVSPSSRVYGLGDMSLFNNISGTTNFPLAEVQSVYRGRTFVVELYDPGDAGGGGTIQVIRPDGSIAPSCQQSVRDEVTQPWTYQGTRTPCQFMALNNGSASDYNGDWVKLEIQIEDTYACTGSCFWRINYVFPGAVQDTTTWRVYVEGAPVHLLPNP